MSPGPLRAARVAAALLFALILVSGCASGRHVRVQVTPGTTLPDEPLHIRVSGLHGGEVATVRLRARDTRGRLWRSAARFRADGSGTVDLDHQGPAEWQLPAGVGRRAAGVPVHGLGRRILRLQRLEAA